MQPNVSEELHQLHGAVKDIAAGFQSLAANARSEIMDDVAALKDLHETHAAELATELRERGETPSDDGSVMGLVHKVVVTVRDWVDGLGSDILPKIQEGEESLLDTYEQTLARLGDDDKLYTLIARQKRELEREVRSLVT